MVNSSTKQQIPASQLKPTVLKVAQCLERPSAPHFSCMSLSLYDIAGKASALQLAKLSDDHITVTTVKLHPNSMMSYKDIACFPISELMVKIEELLTTIDNFKIESVALSVQDVVLAFYKVVY